MAFDEEWEEGFRRDQAFKPQPAVERRARDCFAPEVMFDGGQWVVGPPEQTHEAAMAAASAAAAEIRAMMLEAGRAMIASRRFKKAKA